MSEALIEPEAPDGTVDDDAVAVLVEYAMAILGVSSCSPPSPWKQGSRRRICILS